MPRRRFRDHSRAKSPKVILQPPPTLAELKSELEGELRRIADFETRITTTREEGQKLQRIAEELGIDSLPVLFESCQQKYVQCFEVPPDFLISLARPSAYSGQRTRYADSKPMLSPEASVYWPRFQDTLESYLKALLEELNATKRRLAPQGKVSFWSMLVDRQRHVEVCRPVECAISFVEQAIASCKSSAADVSTVLPMELKNTHRYDYRHETYSLRFADFLNVDFPLTWDTTFKKLVTRHDALIQEFKESVWPEIQTVFRVSLHERIRELPTFKASESAISLFMTRAFQWEKATVAPEFCSENWMQGLWRREALVPWFGEWPFPRKLLWVTEGTLKKRLRKHKSKVQELEIRIAARDREQTAEKLHTQIHELKKEVDQHELEKAAAAAHWGNIRKTAPAVRAKIEREVLKGIGCPYCGGELGPDWHADHIYPVILGGLSTIQNMVAVCLDCNLKKGDHTLLEFAAKYGREFSLIAERLSKLGRRC